MICVAASAVLGRKSTQRRPQNRRMGRLAGGAHSSTELAASRERGEQLGAPMVTPVVTRPLSAPKGLPKPGTVRMTKWFDSRERPALSRRLRKRVSSRDIGTATVSLRFAESRSLAVGRKARVDRDHKNASQSRRSAPGPQSSAKHVY